ncbi:MAG: endospore germination permease [Hyphomonadaceae bacterium]|nr:endospore germination permease [Clostridia bacterium]
MRDREVISGRQLVLLVFTFIIATGTLFVPAIVAQKAMQDGWLSVLIGGSAGVVVVFIVTTLGTRFPGKSLMEYSETILGKWAGKVVGLIFIFFYLHLTSIVVREISSTIQGTLLQNMQLEIITLIMFFACAYSVKLGLETITRANVLNLVVTFIAIFIVLLLLIKDMNPEMLTPFLSNGMMPVLKGAVSPAGWFCEVVSIAFIMPFVNKPEETKRNAIVAIIWAAVTLAFMSMLVTMVFGPQLSSVLSFPTLEAVRYINVGQYVQRVEIIFLIPWIVSNYIKISVFYYISVLIISKWFNIENTRVLVIPVGLVIFSLSLALFKSNVDLGLFLTNVWGIYSLPIELGIPAILLAVELKRKKGRKAKE